MSIAQGTRNQAAFRAVLDATNTHDWGPLRPRPNRPDLGVVDVLSQMEEFGLIDA